MKTTILLTLMSMILTLSSCSNNKSSEPQPSGFTSEQALKGIDNYCHKEYDWSVAKDNPSIMSVSMGEETEKEYQVVFRSYTGAYVYFYVDKVSGTTRMVEYEPTLKLENKIGTINLSDYITSNR